MWNPAQFRLAGIGVFIGLTALSSAAYSATYQCEQDGVVVYSDTRCGPNARQSGETQNLYPGGLRPGEQQMLNEASAGKSAPLPAILQVAMGSESGSRMNGGKLKGTNGASLPVPPVPGVEAGSSRNSNPSN